MYKLLLAYFLIGTNLMLFGQNIDSISLNECLILSEENFNIQENLQNNNSVVNLQKQNLKTNYLPTLKLEAQASYQSEALTIDFPMPGVEFPEVPLDQYKLYLQINQMIYDGGLTNSYKKILDISVKENELNSELTIKNLQKSVSNIFFATILLNSQEKIIDNQLKTLYEQFKIIESSVKNQVLPSVNKDIMESEILKIEQKADDLKVLKESSIKILSAYTGNNLSAQKLIQPKININIADSISSPNLELLKIQDQKLDLLNNQITAQRMPKIYAFGQAGYGKPGLNMLSDEFSPYFFAGVTFSWNIYDWNNAKRKKQINRINQQSLLVQKQNIQTALDIQQINILAKIKSTQIAIEKDLKIIELMNKIIKTYDSQLKNGIITSSEYIIELNKLSQAKLQLELHKIQLEQLKFNFNNIY